MKSMLTLTIVVLGLSSAFAAEEFWKKERDYQVQDLDKTMAGMGELRKCLVAAQSQEASGKCHHTMQDKMKAQGEASKKWHEQNAPKKP